MSMHDEFVAGVLRSLADVTRLTMIRRLSQGETRVADLTDALGLPQSTVSGHIAVLREFGLVTGRPAGRQVFYTLAQPQVLELLTVAEELTGPAESTEE